MKTLIEPRVTMAKRAKVILITEINKRLDDKELTPNDFDILYDLDVDELQDILFKLQEEKKKVRRG